MVLHLRFNKSITEKSRIEYFVVWTDDCYVLVDSCRKVFRTDLTTPGYRVTGNVQEDVAWLHFHILQLCGSLFVDEHQPVTAKSIVADVLTANERTGATVEVDSASTARRHAAANFLAYTA